MTLDEAVARAAAQIDAILEQRYRDLEYRMSADGCPDFDGVEAVVQMQREGDAVWRTNTLRKLRARLHDEFGVR